MEVAFLRSQQGTKKLREDETIKNKKAIILGMKHRKMMS